MAAVPFGFSFGDFVAAIEVIHKAAQALRRTAGARKQIYQAAADLESVQRVLRKIQALTPATVSHETLAAVRLCAHGCYLPLDHFVQRIKTYETHMDQQNGSKMGIIGGIEGGYWKIKWALQVEAEVAKLKAAIGPGLAAIDILLQVESLEKSASTQIDMKHVTNLSRRAVSLGEHICLTLQRQARSMDTRFNKIDVMATATVSDSRKVLQHLPLLASHDQMRGLGQRLDQFSMVLDTKATADQANQLQSQLQDSASTHANYHTESMTNAQNNEQWLRQTDGKIDEIHTLLSAMISAQSTSSATVSSGSPEIRPPGVSSSDKERLPPCARVTSLDKILGPMASLLLELLRKLLCYMVILFAMLPNIAVQLRTCMTFIRMPLLLSGNSIVLTDALNRTKLLPYEYFCDWKLLEPWLQRAFAGLPGESRVARGDFAMFKQYKTRTGPQIPFEQWERCVFAGDEVVMSMLVTSDSAGRECRRCGTIFLEGKDESGWQKCNECKQSYCYIRNRPQSRLRLSTALSSEDDNNKVPNNLSGTTGEDRARQTYVTEDGRFARVHSLRQYLIAELASRPLTPQEAWSLYHFEMHALSCRSCSLLSLCSAGRSLSQDVQVLVCEYGGEVCSTRPDDEGKWIRVEIPHGYGRAKSMLGVKRVKTPRLATIVSYAPDPPPARKRDPSDIVYVEPADTRRDNERRSRDRWTKGGRLRDSDMRRPRRGYHP